MRQVTAAGNRFRQAHGLPAVLDAACDAFEAILTVIGDYEDTTTTGTAFTLLLVATQAANGRDAVLFTPSLPPRQLPRPSAERGRADAPDQGNELDAAIAVGALLEARLSQAAEQSADPADRLGCRTAARYARQIHVLLTGSGP